LVSGEPNKEAVAVICGSLLPIAQSRIFLNEERVIGSFARAGACSRLLQFVASKRQEKGNAPAISTTEPPSTPRRVKSRACNPSTCTSGEAPLDRRPSDTLDHDERRSMNSGATQTRVHSLCRDGAA